MAINFSTFYNVIDGELRAADEFYHGVNPATGEELWPVPVATKDDLEDAVNAGNKAFLKWSQTPVEQRKEAMRNYAKAMLEHTKELEGIVMMETGKPLWLTTFEASAGSDLLNKVATFDIPSFVTHDDDDVKVTTYYEPIGVVGAICPWNFPMLLAMNKIAPAVLMGNTVIVKPSPYTPYSTLKMVEIAQPHFPPGVIQILGGNDQLGPWIVDHPQIPKISFTGSTATGRKINERAARLLKRITLELGGNDAAIVFPDVDIKATAKELAMGALFNNGQYCMAIKRVYIHEDIYDKFLPALAIEMQALQVGDPSDPATMVGPVQNKMQYDKVSALYCDSHDTGLDFVLDGGKNQKIHPSPANGESSNGVHAVNGYDTTIANGDTTRTTNGVSATTNGSSSAFPPNSLFLRPSILSHTPRTSRIMTEEQFGPLLPTTSWRSLDAVIAEANNTPYGLGGSVWSRDLDVAEKVARRLQTGAVWINHTGPRNSSYHAGAKDSGIGGEGGQLALMHYGQPKTVYAVKRYVLGSEEIKGGN